MGHIKHDAIIVTTSNKKAIYCAACMAQEYGLDTIGPSEPCLNGFRTLLVCPDGSNENWPDSDNYAAMRNRYIEYLKGLRYDDGSSCLEWLAVSYGNDNCNAEITAHAWQAGHAHSQAAEMIDYEA